MWRRKGEVLCVRPFWLHRQQDENDRPKQNVEFAPPGKISADAHVCFIWGP